MNYTYVECEENESQYDCYDFSESKIVDAAYIKSKLEVDAGNPYIEALPYPRDDDATEAAYTKMLPTYRFSDVQKLSKLEKMLQVSELREIRFPLPFHKQLEFQFYNSLLVSYRARRPLISKQSNVQYVSDNQEQTTDRKLCGDSGAATNSGFSLIGFSGCGKSSAINTLVSRYPQVIMHQDGKGGYFPQIVYLIVNCVANSNFAALYEGIGDAIDKAFDNTIPIYSREIAHITSLGRKAEKVKEYIEKFGIGMIIFDEIQLIDFAHTKENTFESLMTLSNRTKVAIAVVGTEDARDKMFRQLRTARRVGKMINGNVYCENKMFFELLASQLFQYQWFDEPVDLTDEIVDALYDVTKGIVDQLIGIYSCMNYDYLDRKKKPKVNGKYVYDVAHRYYPGMQEVLANLAATEKERKTLEIDKERKIAEIREKSADKVAEVMDRAKQEEAMTAAINNRQKTAQNNANLNNVVTNIMNVYDEYSARQIEEAFYKVINKKSSSGKTEKEITRMAIELLQKSKKAKNTKITQKPDVEHMQDFLNKG